MSVFLTISCDSFKNMLLAPIREVHSFSFGVCQGELFPLQQCGTGNVYLKLKGKHCRKPHSHNGVVDHLTYSRVPNITVDLNKSVGGNFSWKLIKK